MTRQLFLEIVNHELYETLFIIILFFLFCWWSQFQLSYLLLGVKVSAKRMIPALFVMMTFSLFSKQFINMTLCAIIAPFLMAFLICITVKGTHYLKAGWVALSSIIVSNVGSISIASLLCATNPRVNYFLLHTPLGLVTGTGLDTLFPLLAIVIMPRIKLKTSLIPPINAKPDRMDIKAIFIYFSIYATNYFAALIVYISFINHYHFILVALAIYWCTAIATIGGHYQHVKTMTQTFEKEKSDLITEKTNLETAKLSLEADKSILEADKLSLKADKARLESDKSKLEANKIGLEAIKTWLEADKVRVEAEARKLDFEKNRLSELTNRLEEENTKLLTQIQELAKSSANGESAREKMLTDLLMKHSAESEKILGPIRIKRSKLNDKDKNILNVLTGKSNHEIVDILSLDEEESIIFVSIIQGRSNREIAATLNMAEGSVGNTVGRFLKKFELSDRDQLLPYILEYFANIGLIQPGKSPE